MINALGHCTIFQGHQSLITNQFSILIRGSFSVSVNFSTAPSVEEALMFHTKQPQCSALLFTFAAICVACTLWAQGNNAGSQGPLADSCGAPAQGAGSQGQGARGTPVFPAGQYPVKLPAVSLLGARNDLPNPFRPGVHWGQLPVGRKWGSTAGVYAGSDGKTIWAIDRCGASGAGGTTCVDSPLDPVLQFDTSGKLLQSFGKGLIVSPHKISVDKDGNVWVADNGSAPGKGQQVLKFSSEGKLLMKLGKPGVAGPGLDEFDLPTEVAVAPNGDIFVADGYSGGGIATGNARIMNI